MSNIVFEYPFAFLLLALFIVCAIFCKAKSEALIFPHLDIFSASKTKRSFLTPFLKWCAILLSIIALASPVIEDKLEVEKKEGYAIALLLDASGSMRPYGQTDKFGITKEIVDEFISKRENDQISLVVFADFAYVASPLTYDNDMLKEILKNIEVGIAGKRYTAIYDALFFGAKLFSKSNAKSKVAILLTDGENNAKSIPIDTAMKMVEKYGVKVYTIGIGSSRDFNRAELLSIAKRSGGEFFAARSKEKLQEVYDKIDKLERSELQSDKYVKKSYYFQYPLILALVFLLAYSYLVNRRGIA